MRKCVSVDGVRVFEEDMVYFADWIQEFVGCSWNRLRNDLLADGKGEEEIDDERAELMAAFEEWAEDFELEACEY